LALAGLHALRVMAGCAAANGFGELLVFGGADGTVFKTLEEDLPRELAAAKARGDEKKVRAVAAKKWTSWNITPDSAAISCDTAPCSIPGKWRLRFRTRCRLSDMIETLAPARARRKAMARPSPLAPPVTIATRPERKLSLIEVLVSSEVAFREPLDQALRPTRVGPAGLVSYPVRTQSHRRLVLLGG